MRFRQIAVGRAKPGPEYDLFEQYRRRLTTPLTLVEIDDRKGPADVLARTEAALAGCDYRIALDETGEALGSRALSDRLARWRNQGHGDIALLIGGADGHAPSIRASANWLWAFGPATWPHMLVRAMVAEQLYRAETILAGHPYHRG